MAKKKRSAKEKVSLVKAIYLYAAVATGIVILIIGAYSGIRTLLNTMFLDEYPVPGETFLCEEMSSGGQETDYERCLENVDSQRKTALVSDVARTVSSLIVGPAILIPHAIWDKGSAERAAKEVASLSTSDAPPDEVQVVPGQESMEWVKRALP